MLTEKEIELIENHLRGKLNDEDNSLVERKIASDSLYKEKYDELFILSKAIERFEQHNSVIERIKKQTASNIRQKPTDRPIINLTRYLTNKNLGIAASITLIFGFSYYFITNESKTIQDYAAPSRALVKDSLKTDSLETANDSLKALKNFLK